LRCVFDTNVFVSAALFRSSTPRRALNLAFEHGVVLLSVPAMTELIEVLRRRKFQRYVDESSIREFVSAIANRVEWVEIDARVRVCRDPKDDKFLELAASGRATYLVTGDADLLVLNPFQGIEILTPNRFLEIATARS
jgi:uncharacterized protein